MEPLSNTINKKVRSSVEKLGFENTLKIFGGNKDIIRRAYQDNPSSFLNQFNNLKPVIKDDKIYYVDENNKPLFYYYRDENDEYYYINYDRIWSFFDRVFRYEYTEIQELIKIWLGETYNLKKLEPFGVLMSQYSWERPII